MNTSEQLAFSLGLALAMIKVNQMKGDGPRPQNTMRPQITEDVDCVVLESKIKQATQTQLAI